MTEERITAKIFKDGKVSIEVGGVQGESCLELTQQLEVALGKVTDRKEKPEIHERPVVVQTIATQHIKS